MATYDATSVRLQLLDNGYHPIPLWDKKPRLKGWNGPAFENPSEDDVRGWARGNTRSNKATGIHVRDGLMSLDIDIRDEEVCDLVLEELYRIAPEVYAGPWRYGSRPKTMVFARWVPSERWPDMFTQWNSGKYTDAAGVGNHIEVFGGRRTAFGKASRFVVLYGPHSHEEGKEGDKGWDLAVTKEYSWEEEAHTLKDVPLASLPIMTQDQMWALLKFFDDTAKARGWEMVLPPAKAGSANFIYDIDEATRFNVENGPQRISYTELCSLDDSNLRVDGEFIDGSTARKDKCRVGWCNAREAVGVFAPDEYAWHLPKSAEPPTLDGSQPLDLSKLAGEASGELPKGSKRGDFYAFLPKHEYIYIPTGALWPAASINAVLDKIVVGQKAKKQTKAQIKDGEMPVMVDVTIPPSLWLDRHRAVQAMGWSPSHPQTIDGKLAVEGGWVEQDGAKTFNLYKPPPPRSLNGNPDEAAPWVALVRRVYPDHADHIMAYLAHCIQFPGVKINHALVLVGTPGIGKDTLLEPLSHGLGEWNFKEVTPQEITSKHNDYRKCTVLRISETHDLGDTTRYAFYNTTKSIVAAPPNMVRIDTKYVPQYYIDNVNSTIMTSNHASDGLYLVADDRRHYVAGTEIKMEDHAEGYLPGIWEWYNAGGLDHVVAWLHAYDLAGFDAKAPPRKTLEFWRMVDAGLSTTVPELRDLIDALGTTTGTEPNVVVIPPDVVTLDLIREQAAGGHQGLYNWLSDKKNARQISHQMEDCGYAPVRNMHAKDGQWRVGGRRATIYARQDLPSGARISAAEQLQDEQKGKIARIYG